MSVVSNSPKYLFVLALLAGASSASVAAQTPEAPAADVSATAYLPAEQTAGPEIKGLISARSGDMMQVTAADGAKSVIAIKDAPKNTPRKGRFGPKRTRHTP